MENTFTAKLNFEFGISRRYCIAPFMRDPTVCLQWLSRVLCIQQRNENSKRRKLPEKSRFTLGKHPENVNCTYQNVIQKENVLQLVENSVNFQLQNTIFGKST